MFHGERSPDVPRGTATSQESRPPPESDRQAIEQLLERELTGGGDASAIERLVDFSLLLAQWAQRINLTGHRDPLSITRHLILDTIALDPFVPQTDHLIDIGSGAGLPGIPLAILRPDCRVVAVEPRSRRIYFQRAVVRELGLKNFEPRLGRSEDLEPESGGVVIAQALARPERACELMLPWCRPGGWLVIPTSASVELDEAGRNSRIQDAEITTYRELDPNDHVVWRARVT